MTQSAFEQLMQLQQTQGDTATLDRLIETLRSEKNYHALFPAILLKKKFELKLPLVQPTSFEDVPADREAEFEATYVDAAREVGNLFLADNNISQAWIYFRTIREPEPVAKALESIDLQLGEDPDRADELINVALMEGANPARGLELMLASRGTCNTITAVDHHMHQLNAGDRRRAIGALIRDIYGSLCLSVRRDIERKGETAPTVDSLRELISGCDGLFGDGNYHVDVSHLSSVVRFARFLDSDDANLPKAIELAEYGSRLARQLQYPGDAPFEDFYIAHLHFLTAIAGSHRDEALDYFRHKLDAASDEDKPFVAFVLVDLLIRCELLEQAVDVAAAHLQQIDNTAGFSFAKLCRDAGRLDALRARAMQQSDLVTYTAALLQQTTGRKPG